MLNSSIRIIALMITMFTVIEGHSARTITVMSHSTGVSLINPSTVSVSFDVVCFDPNGTQTITKSGESLAPNQSRDYGKAVDFSAVTDATACSGTPAVYSYYQNVSCGGTTLQAKACPDTATYSGVASKCGVGMEPCEYINGNYMTCSGFSGFWIKPPSSGTVEISSDGGCTWTNLNTANDSLVLSDRWSCGSAMYNSSCRVNGTGTTTGCGSASKSSSYGVICCAAKAPSFCKVTINSTDVNAHLASPGFKGGAPF